MAGPRFGMGFPWRSQTMHAEPRQAGHALIGFACPKDQGSK